eukprot:7380564-Pyramimonas_sp.AAC.1
MGIFMHPMDWHGVPLEFKRNHAFLCYESYLVPWEADECKEISDCSPKDFDGCPKDAQRIWMDCLRHPMHESRHFSDVPKYHGCPKGACEFPTAYDGFVLGSY